VAVSHHRLILHPRDPFFVPETTAVLEGLREIGFVGPALDACRYRVGSRFMEWVSFLGCSPWLRLEPDAQQTPFTHIHVPHQTPVPILIAGDNVKPPRCPHCRKGFMAPGRPPRPPPDPTAVSRCASCGTPAPWSALDWRRSACVARWRLEVTEIHEAEAVPTPGLLDRLAALSAGRPWGYCYVQTRKG